MFDYYGTHSEVICLDAVSWKTKTFRVDFPNPVAHMGLYRE